MPGVYSANRNAAGGEAGFFLPLPPTTGPLRFREDATGYRDVPMYHHFLGQTATVTGLQTHLISECAVFAAVERVPGGGGRAYFAHVQGGDWSGDWASKAAKPVVQAARQALIDFTGHADVNSCYSLMVLPGEYGYARFAALPQSLGLPARNLTLYISNTASGLGIALNFRHGCRFGEIDNPAPKSSGSMPYGPRIGAPAYPT